MNVQVKIEKIGDGFVLLRRKQSQDVGGLETGATVAVQDRTLSVSPQPSDVREGRAQAARQVREQGNDQKRQGGHAISDTDDVGMPLVARWTRRRGKSQSVSFHQ